MVCWLQPLLVYTRNKLLEGNGEQWFGYPGSLVGLGGWQGWASEVGMCSVPGNHFDRLVIVLGIKKKQKWGGEEGKGNKGEKEKKKKGKNKENKEKIKKIRKKKNPKQ